MDRPRQVHGIDDIETFWRWLSAEPRIAFDLETSGFDIWSPEFKIRLIQFGSCDDAWVIEFEKWQGLVADVFKRYRGEWLAHNARFDTLCLRRYGIIVPWAQIDDTMIMMRLAAPTESAALKNAADKHVSTASSRGQKILQDAFRINKWTWATVPLDFPPLLYYAALDTILTSRLADTAVAREGRRSPVYDLEMQVRAVCSQMEWNGFRIDRAFCGKRSEELRVEARAIQDIVEADYGVRIGSNDDLSKWLLASDARDALVKTTRGGKISVDKESLEAVVAFGSGAPRHVAEQTLRARKLNKVAGYFDSFVDLSDGRGVLHPQIETVAARTGRMSIKEPGLQTLPKPGEDPDYRSVREAVVPMSEEDVLISCDADQIELRLAASLSGDPGLIEAFAEADRTGLDFFTASARQIYGDPTMVKSDPRRGPIKSFFYAALYGAGVEKMAVTAGVPVADMRNVRDQIVTRFPGFFRLMLACEAEAKENDGWIETAYGRRLLVDDGGYYKATNYRIQGSAADILKQSLVNLAQAGLDGMMLIPVHDEVLLSVPQKHEDEVRHLIATNMPCYDFAVPLTATPSYGCMNWADAKD